MRLTLLFLLAVVAYGAVRDETAQSDDSVNQDMKFPLSLNSVQLAFNKSSPTDNVEIFKYDPSTIYKVRLRTAMKTTFVLPPGEKIVSYNVGDKLIFNFEPVVSKAYNTENMFTLQPRAAGADTSVTVIGASGRIYYFYVRADNHESAFMPHLGVYVSLDGGIPELGDLSAKSEKFAPNLSHFAVSNLDFRNANFDYISLSGGDKTLRPDAVFDDGKWTYFQFKNRLGQPRRLPVVYRVVDGYDNPVNARVEGEYLIAETINDRWTLRAGDAHLCIARGGKGE